MRLPLLLASAIALAACTAHDTPSDGNGTAAKGNATASATHSATAPRAHRARAIAGLPDRGQLLAYTASATVSRSAYTWHSVALSEDHALNAIATGTLDVPAPDGSTIALKFDHVVDHGDGNWTWVGRPAGAKPGTEAIITFGPKAVFGTVPYGRKPALRIGSAQGRTFLMDTDPVKLAHLVKAGHRPTGPDYALPPALAGARDKVLQRAAAQPTPQALVAAGAVPESNTVDVVLGYTNGFASRLGGASQAGTRLNHLVAVANQAFTNSQINGRIRLVGTVPVTYPDNTNNETALRALSGVTCTENPDGSLDCDEAPIPAALQPLVTKREQLHADLMSIVRNFTTENTSCGIAWLIGSGEEPISAEDAYAGISVISDSNGSGDDDSTGAPFPDDGYVCRNETLAHELAHNMGSAHDATTAAGDDGTLTVDEHGRYPYSFGYKTDAGAFYTIMAYGDDGQTAYRIFSNPRTNYCGGMACGTANADNARSLNSTIPVVASFYTTLVSPKVARADFNGDGKSDVWFRNVNGYNTVWLSANIHTPQTMKGVAAAWQIVGMGDFNGDDRADVMWRNVSSGQNVIWRSGLASTPQAMALLAGADWKVKGVIDINGDGLADVLWRNEVLGQNRIWKSGNAATLIPVANLAGTAWKIVGVGDFEGDGKGDILWRNSTSGLNVIWRNGNSATSRSLQTLADQGWKVAGVGDFDGDAKSDVMWRHTNGANAIWRSGNSSTPKSIAGVAAAWQVKCVADFNGDGDDDLLFRNGGANVIWRSGSSATAQSMSAADVAWSVNC